LARRPLTDGTIAATSAGNLAGPIDDRDGGMSGQEHGTPLSGRDHTGLLAGLARACSTHAWRTIGLWIVLAAGIIVATATVGGSLVDEFTIPNSDAQRAQDLLEERFPARSGDSATLVYAVSNGELGGADARAAVERSLAAAEEIPGVESVGDPFAGTDGALSENGRIARVDVQFDRPAFEVPKASVTGLQDDATAALEGTDVQVEFTGQVIQAAQEPASSASELLGLLAAIIILIFMLGGLIAAGLPILMALVSVTLGISLLTLAAALTNFNTITPVVATMLGLGVGIDYSLFIVTRFRQGIHDGMNGPDAATVAAATAGRAVLFAGLTVAISISALAVIGLDFITKLGLGAAITVATAVAAAVTLLPAILSLIGTRIDRLKVPFVRISDDSEASRENSRMGRWARFVTRNALACALIVTGLLVVLAIPVASAQLGASDAGSSPPDTTTRKAYDLLAEGFGPGFNGPLVIAVDQPAGSDAAARIAAGLSGVPGIAFVADPLVNEGGDAAVITAFPTTAPQDKETQDLVELLRGDVIAAALADADARAYVGGPTAAFEDISQRIYDRMPLFLLAVIGITFVLLSMAFRSVVVAIKAALTTLLSAVAAFGVLIAVFQWGWAQGLIGLDRTGPIESFVPVIVFAILFGLSMDYEVFLVSRIREEYTLGYGARPAIVRGMSAIGRVIVAAALIMAVVFLAFLLGEDRVVKEFGLALGLAVLIDAFLVRLILVPAIMHLADERMWYMPRWLDRVLPRFTIEPPHAAPDPPPPEAAPVEAASR
jgi:RND superfamily putative drug exporter